MPSVCWLAFLAAALLLCATTAQAQLTGGELDQCNTWFSNYDYLGRDIGNGRAANREACKTMCLARVDCNALTFVKSSRWCWIKTVPVSILPTFNKNTDSMRICEDPLTPPPSPTPPPPSPPPPPTPPPTPPPPSPPPTPVPTPESAPALAPAPATELAPMPTPASGCDTWKENDYSVGLHTHVAMVDTKEECLKLCRDTVGCLSLTHTAESTGNFCTLYSSEPTSAYTRESWSLDVCEEKVCGVWLENTDFDSVVIAVEDARDRHHCKMLCKADDLCNAVAFIPAAEPPARNGLCHFKSIEKHTIANPDIAAASLRLCPGAPAPSAATS